MISFYLIGFAFKQNIVTGVTSLFLTLLFHLYFTYYFFYYVSLLDTTTFFGSAIEKRTVGSETGLCLNQSLSQFSNSPSQLCQEDEAQRAAK